MLKSSSLLALLSTVTVVACGGSTDNPGSDAGAPDSSVVDTGVDVGVDAPADPCAGQPCQNGGTCTSQGGDFTCACAPGYDGKTCSNNIDDCTPNPCLNGGTCVDGVNAYTCNCTKGYTGKTCDTPPTSCLAIKKANPSSTDGDYMVLPDGLDGGAPFQVYCDMTYDDGNGAGGWTLVESTANMNGPSGLTEGTVTTGSATYMPLADMLALAAGATQVHIRSTGKADTESATSIAGGPPIVHLRTGNMVTVLGDATNEYTLWTGPYADAAHLDFTCANYDTAWPNLIQSCGTDGIHIWRQHSRWNWSSGNASLNVDMEVYVR